MLAMIKQISIFIICAQMILHFKAEQKYGKYLKLLIGVMVLAQLFVPLMSLLGQGEEVFAEKLTYYMSRVAGNGEGERNTGIPGEEDFTKLQIQEIKSIFNNVQGEGEATTETEEGKDKIPNDTSDETFREGTMSQTGEADSEIIIERIEVKPDDG